MALLRETNGFLLSPYIKWGLIWWCFSTNGESNLPQTSNHQDSSLHYAELRLGLSGKSKKQNTIQTTLGLRFAISENPGLVGFYI